MEMEGVQIVKMTYKDETMETDDESFTLVSQKKSVKINHVNIRNL